MTSFTTNARTVSPAKHAEITGALWFGITPERRALEADIARQFRSDDLDEKVDAMRRAIELRIGKPLPKREPFSWEISADMGSGFGSGDTYCGKCGGAGGYPLDDDWEDHCGDHNCEICPRRA